MQCLPAVSGTAPVLLGLESFKTFLLLSRQASGKYGAFPSGGCGGFLAVRSP